MEGFHWKYQVLKMVLGLTASREAIWRIQLWSWSKHAWVSNLMEKTCNCDFQRGESNHVVRLWGNGKFRWASEHWKYQALLIFCYRVSFYLSAKIWVFITFCPPFRSLREKGGGLRMKKQMDRLKVVSNSYKLYIDQWLHSFRPLSTLFHSRLI